MGIDTYAELDIRIPIWVIANTLVRAADGDTGVIDEQDSNVFTFAGRRATTDGGSIVKPSRVNIKTLHTSFSLYMRHNSQHPEEAPCWAVWGSRATPSNIAVLDRLTWWLGGKFVWNDCDDECCVRYDGMYPPIAVAEQAERDEDGTADGFTMWERVAQAIPRAIISEEHVEWAAYGQIPSLVGEFPYFTDLPTV